MCACHVRRTTALSGLLHIVFMHLLCTQHSVHDGVSILMHAECGGAKYRAVNVIVVVGGVWCHWASGAREPVPGRLHTYAQLFLE